MKSEHTECRRCRDIQQPKQQKIDHILSTVEKLQK